MDYISRIPYILSLLMGIISGVLSSVMKDNSKYTYTRMIVSIIIFYFLGKIIKNMIEKTINEINEKIEKEKMEKEKEEQIKREELNQSLQDTEHDDNQNVSVNSSKIDYTAGDDDFLPMEFENLNNKR